MDRALEWEPAFDKERNTTLPQWLSGYRDRHPCKILTTYHGSFNWSCSVRFDDGITWLVRFAVPGKVMDGDAKVAREVATMYYVKSHTTIPIPAIHHWGLERYNHLLNLYVDEMKKSEENMDTNTEDRLSHLMRQSISDGKFWFHALIESCYDGDYCPPWKALRKLIPNVDKHSCLPESYRQAFVAKKLEDLSTYTASWEAMQAKRETESKRKERDLDDAIRRILVEEPNNVPALKLASQRGIII